MLPFLALEILDIFVLPVDFFTFRVWEGASSMAYRYPGGFYPNLHVKKAKEYADRYRLGNPEWVESKPVEWFTDSSGWRNRPEIEKKKHYDFVVNGDSNIVGSYLDQKDTLSEVLSNRSEKVVYSYALGHDTLALFFSDPKILRKRPGCLIAESKVGNWSTNSDHLVNFREMPDGSLDVDDRTQEFTTNFYSPNRNPGLERIRSRFLKQSLFRFLKAEFFEDFVSPVRDASALLKGSEHPAAPWQGPLWRPSTWFVDSGAVKPLPGEPQVALKIRAMGSNCYWHTERFISARADGEILVRFEAKNSISVSPHRIYIFENGGYRTLGEIIVDKRWKTFEITIPTALGSILEFQIDQRDDWQFLMLRDFQVINAAPLPVEKRNELMFSMDAWTKAGDLCKESAVADPGCRQWPAGSGKKYRVESPVLPTPGEGGQWITFEARTEKQSGDFSSIFLFEGEKRGVIAQYEFVPEWRKFQLFLKPRLTTQNKIQIEFSRSAGALSVRNARVFSVDKMPKEEERNQTTLVSPKIPEASQQKGAENHAPFPRPPNLTPLDGSGRVLTPEESRYYFYHAAKAMQRKASERGMDLIIFIMPDLNISRLMPVIRELRKEGVKVLAYDQQDGLPQGVDESWYWQKADSHWTEAAVRLTADEILRMWKEQKVENRPFSTALMNAYTSGFPNERSSDPS
ncbi:MAG: hypothetical protein V1882_11810 [Candidatus Omnitrophota bacterium]